MAREGRDGQTDGILLFLLRTERVCRECRWRFRPEIDSLLLRISTMHRGAVIDAAVTTVCCRVTGVQNTRPGDGRCSLDGATPQPATATWLWSRRGHDREDCAPGKGGELRMDTVPVLRKGRYAKSLQQPSSQRFT